MKKILFLFVMILGVIPTMWADISVQTIIFDENSQPPIVGGIIDGYSADAIVKKGIIVSSSIDDAVYKEEEFWYNASYYSDDSKSVDSNLKPMEIKDYRKLDCTIIGEEQFWCSLKLLKPNSDYYVRAFVIYKDENVSLGNIEKLRTQSFSRYDGKSDYANVWYAFDYTLFDLVTDEIINPNDGFYYSTNESPTRVRHQVGTSYNTCYKFATEWNYKLWYYHNANHSDKNKMINHPIMSYSNGKLSIEKNPLDADKDITIYYSINGNYFRPETYTNVYTAPIEITEPCAVYCYAISSDGYISYTNMYYVEQTNDVNEFGTVADVVDLGLSVKWASWNVGADKPEGLGNLYAWGELSPKTDYSTSTYKFYDNGYTKYGSIDNKYQLDSEDDVAQQTWGDKWRIPTIEELKELKEKCTFTRTELNGVPVTKVTGPNGNFIYFPYPGNFTDTTLYFENSIGSYWSSDLESDSYAKDLDFLSGMPDLNGDSRYHGQSIRPVYVESTNPDDNNDEDFGTVAEIVDLGLSVKWASWNVGADKPEGLGNLYAWGELSPKTDYSTSTYKFYDNGYTKYGSIDNKYQLDSEDDVAQQTWGDKWRIPTIEELKELKEKCTFTRTELNGVPVTKVTGPNGNFIYFPYPGNFTDTTLYFENSIGSYWSSDLESDSYAKDLDFLSGMPDLNGDSRYHGQSIRPVYVEHTSDTYGKVPDIIDLGLSSGTLWASWNLGASSPEEYGAYFAWGETTPKNNYDWNTYKFGKSSNFTKYNTFDGLTELELEDDAANVILGKDWRMPTHQEELELVNECSWESSELNGISGYKVTGPNGNSIFLPRGGLYDGTDYDSDGTTISNANSCGWYWSSTLNSVGSAYAQGLCFFPSLLTNVSDHERCDGHNIRPVYIRSLTPTDDNGGVDYGNGDIDDNSNLNGNVIGDIYYNISDENGEYSSVEGCITLKKSISDSDMNNIVGKNIFSEDFKNDFTGIVFMVQAGQGTIKVNAESLGSMTLKVKIGNSTPMTFELEGKMKASIPYSVTEPTYVYIYGGETSTANARGLRAVSSDNALKIYGIEWSGEATSIEFINRDVETKAVIYNLNGQRVEKPSKGIYIKNGKKVVIK